MKTALVHDWLTGWGGGEKVLEAIYELYPAKIHTLVKNPKKLIGSCFAHAEIDTSFIQSLPFAKKLYRNYLPFFPLAIEQFDMSEYDLVLSTSHAVAKGVLTHSNQLHICYCHSPMRYAWDLYPFHMSHVSGIKKKLAQIVLHSLRKWDYISSSRVDAFIANSSHVARRIRKIYGREAHVIYPPVDTDLFNISSDKQDYYITYSRLVPYKKIDLIVEAFSSMQDKKLIVIGNGPEMPIIKSKATKNIEILGYQSNERVKSLLSKAKAFIFAAEEDFGIVMVEALAAGVPVIAFEKGASKEIIKEDVSGLFFPRQDVDSIRDAIKDFEMKEGKFDPQYIKSSSERFSRERFKKEYAQFIDLKKQEFFS